MTRSLLKEKGLPAMMWVEAVRHLVYILNRLPTKALSGETPYEAWTSVKPKLDHLRVFGCLAHVKVPNRGLSKLDDRSVTMVYIGKEPGTKAHRLYNPNTGPLHVSRDVVFEEGNGWNWEYTEIVGNNLSDTFVIIGAQTGVQWNDDAGTYTPGTPSSVTPHTPSYVSQSVQGSNSTGYTEYDSETSSEPMNFRLISSIYDETEEVKTSEELLLMGVEEPRTFEQANESENWKEVMKVEIESIKKNKTWVLTDLPPGRKPISLKWVYKIKRDTNGDVVKYKARLMARGYVQKKRIDYDEVSLL